MYGGNNDFIIHCVVLYDMVLRDMEDSVYDRPINKMMSFIQWNRKKKTKSCVSRVKFYPSEMARGQSGKCPNHLASETHCFSRNQQFGFVMTDIYTAGNQSD